MKSPIKLENDFQEYSRTEKVTLAVVLALVVLVVISLASQGFAFSETGIREQGSDLSHSFRYEAPVTTNVNHLKNMQQILHIFCVFLKHTDIEKEQRALNCQ